MTEEESSEEYFCWVKTVVKKSGVVTADARATAVPVDLNHPLIKFFKSDDPFLVAGKLVAPPPPAESADASGIKLGAWGAGTRPPNKPSMIPRRVVAWKSGAGAGAGTKPATFWRFVSVAPGRRAGAEDAAVALEFLPMAGSREQVVRWRADNPDWFADAVAVSLINFGFDIPEA